MKSHIRECYKNFRDNNSTFMWLLRIAVFFTIAFYGWIFFTDCITGRIHFSFLDIFEPYIEHQFLYSAYKRVSGLIWVIGCYAIWINTIEKPRQIPDLLWPKKSIVKSYLLGMTFGAILALIPYFFYQFYGTLVIKSFDATPKTLMIDFIGVLIFSTCTSVMEELICRGFLITRLEQRWNIHLVVIVQAVIFGLLHYNNGRDFSMIWTTALAGLTFGYLFINSRNLYSVIAMHSSVHLSNLLYSSILFHVISNESNDKIYNLLGSSNLGGFIGFVAFILLTLYLILRYSNKNPSSPHANNKT